MTAAAISQNRPQPARGGAAYQTPAPNLDDVKSGGAAFSLGMSGASVRELQETLIADGLDIGSRDGKPDGKFGPATKKAMETFKARHNAQPWDSECKAPPTPANDTFDAKASSQPAPKSSSTPTAAAELASQAKPVPSKSGEAIDKSAFQGAAGTVRESAEYWEKNGAAGGVKQAGKEISDAVERKVDDAGKAIDDAGKAIGDGADKAFRKGAGVVKESAQYWQEHGAVGGVKQAGKEIGQAAERTIDDASKAVTGAYNDASKAVTGTIDDASKAVNGAYNDASKAVTGTIDDAGKAVNGAYNDVAKSADEAFRSTAGAAKDTARYWEKHGAIGGVAEAGKEIGQAAERTYDDASKAVTGAYHDAGKAITGAYNDAGKAASKGASDALAAAGDGFKGAAGTVAESAGYWEQHGLVGGLKEAWSAW